MATPFFSKQGNGAWTNGAKTTYQKHPETPPALSMSNDAIIKPVPMAIAVEVDAPAAQPHTNAEANTSACRRKEGFISRIRRGGLLLVFHVLNFTLGLAAFIIVVTFIPLSVGLLPLCCFGVVTFQLLAIMTEYLAKLDVALANLIIDDQDKKLSVHPRIVSGLSVPDQRSAFSKLIFMSSKTIGAMLYFATLKFAVGVLSCVVAACVVHLPISAIWTPYVSDTEFAGVSYDDHPVAYVLIAVGTFLLGLVVLPLVASLSRKLTEFACADSRKGSVVAAMAV